MLVDEPQARPTLTAQFFGEETAEGAEKNVWTPLRRERVGVLSAYNVEAETYDSLNSPETIRECVDGTIEAIRKVGAFGVKNSAPADVANGDTRCWVRTKVSGLLPDPKIMIRASEYIVDNRKGSVYYPGVPEDGDFDRLMNGKGLSVEVSIEEPATKNAIRSLTAPGPRGAAYPL